MANKIPIFKRTKCPACHCKGKIAKERIYDSRIYVDKRVYFETCRKCKGKGYIKCY